MAHCKQCQGVLIPPPSPLPPRLSPSPLPPRLSPLISSPSSLLPHLFPLTFSPLPFSLIPPPSPLPPHPSPLTSPPSPPLTSPIVMLIHSSINHSLRQIHMYPTPSPSYCPHPPTPLTLILPYPHTLILPHPHILTPSSFHALISPHPHIPHTFILHLLSTLLHRRLVWGLSSKLW